ncbi:MAG: Ppx/GppA family phosphatase [Deltaproteobacteria bacterium]|nr:Ppx/GppA family phosphatase [Deltaproteobacteria bacterium]
MSSPRFAFIDIGTNTILCLIAELRDGGRFRVLDDLAEITRLGQGVDRTGVVSSEGEQRTSDVLRRYLDTCKTLGVEQIIAVGTSALRDAQNSGEIRQRWRAQLGLDVRVIAGHEEAAYSFLAVQRGLSPGGQELLVVDIGGGSTELIHGNQSGVLQAVSMNLGSVRLTERFLGSDHVSDDEFATMTAVIDRELQAMGQPWAQVAARSTWVGIAGTFTTLAAVEMKLARYSHSRVHGCILTRQEVQRQVRLFQSKAVTDRKAIVGLEPNRADIILAGACLIGRMMMLFGAHQVIVSDQGVRYGLLYERLGRI